MSLLGLEATLCAENKKKKKKSSMTVVKGCRPLVSNGYYTLWISSIPSENAEKLRQYSELMLKKTNTASQWMTAALFLLPVMVPACFSVCFHQLTASCKPVEAARLENITKLPPSCYTSHHFLLSPDSSFTE